MKKELFDKIDERYEMIPEAFGGPVPESEIDEAEEELRVKLPEEYREFIRRYGSGGVGDAVILGLRQAEFLSTPSFVKETEAFRNDLPKEYSNMIVIGVDGAGNPIGFQPPDQTTFLLDHNFEGYVKLAVSFEDYLSKALSRKLGIHF
ncbi:SMI1/KNR4 family protein [Kroppenstedtia eburnea]|uniref:SMI1/KNR4 family protein n=1 Tax=Kroppenstedtia eburnea TaxID=714067 RepID=UPI003644D8C8